MKRGTQPLNLVPTSFFTILERTWNGGGGGGVAIPHHLASDRDRASQQRPADSLRHNPNMMVRELTHLGQPLTFQFQVRSDKESSYRFLRR